MAGEEQEERGKQNYQIASTDGTETIDDVDENKTGRNFSGQDKRFLLNWKLIPQHVNSLRYHFRIQTQF